MQAQWAVCKVLISRCHSTIRRHGHYNMSDFLGAKYVLRFEKPRRAEGSRLDDMNSVHQNLEIESHIYLNL